MTIGLSEAAKPLKVVNRGGWAASGIGSWRDAAGCLTLLKPQVERVAADVEHPADAALLLPSIYSRKGFVS